MSKAEIILLAAAAHMTPDTRRYVRERLAKIIEEEMEGYEENQG